MDWSVDVRIDQGEKRRLKTGRGIRQGCCLSQILFKFYREYFIKEALE